MFSRKKQFPLRREIFQHFLNTMSKKEKLLPISQRMKHCQTLPVVPARCNATSSDCFSTSFDQPISTNNEYQKSSSTFINHESFSILKLLRKKQQNPEMPKAVALRSRHWNHRGTVPESNTDFQPSPHQDSTQANCPLIWSGFTMFYHPRVSKICRDVVLY